MKKCTKCKKLKHESGFYKNIKLISELSSVCKVCCSIRAREYWRKNTSGEEYADQMLSFLEWEPFSGDE